MIFFRRCYKETSGRTDNDIVIKTSFILRSSRGACQNSINLKLKSVPWTLTEFRHNRIVQSPRENYFTVCRRHREK